MPPTPRTPPVVHPQTYRDLAHALRPDGRPLIPVCETPDDLRQYLAYHSASCIVWTDYTNKRGYGNVMFRGRLWLAHRLIYALNHRLPLEPYQPPFHLIQTCGNRLCVADTHLMPERQAPDEARRKYGTPNLRKTQCPKGHPYDAKNTYVHRDGSRSCRACQKLRDFKKQYQQRLARQGVWLDDVQSEPAARGSTPRVGSE